MVVDAGDLIYAIAAFAPTCDCAIMSGLADPFDLNRFADAQKDVFHQALHEIGHGKKRSHWMWFIFPQIAGLGSSEMARRFAIGSIDEARAYLAHPVLGARYREIIAALQDLESTDSEQVFGSIDAQKLRSSLTLFAMVSEEPLIAAALDRWSGLPDRATLELARQTTALRY